MDFLRSHLHYHRAPSSSLTRQAPAAAESDPLSPQPYTTGVSDQGSSVSYSSPPRSAMEQEPLKLAQKARKRDSNELDSAVLSFITRASTRRDEQEDPAVGWFKSLLPMYNTLTSIEKLEFQSKVTLDLKSVIVAKEQRMTRQPMPFFESTNIQQQEHYSTSQDTPSIPEYEYYKNYH